MDKAKRLRLRKAGWTIGTAEEFLGLTPEDSAIIELKLALSDALRDRRSQMGLTQAELADRMGSSQSRVAKMEVGAPGISLDLLIRALVTLGASRADIAAIIGARPRQRTRRRA